MPEDPILTVEHLGKTYGSGPARLTVLEDIGFELSPGQSCAIIGPSGSGKTTLLGLCAGLDQPTTGSVRLAGTSLSGLSEDALARLRGVEVGFVFQSFRLIPTLTALENVMVPLELAGRADARVAAGELLERVGLEPRASHYPTQLSGGEQQRVALARAFVNRPRILFADEPTGNLDDRTSEIVVDLLFELNADRGTTLVLVTHDDAIAARADRILPLKGGRLVSPTTAPDPHAPATLTT